MSTANLSLLNESKKIVLSSYDYSYEHPTVTAKVISRLAAFAFLSTSAAFDMVMHSLFILPTFIYSIGTSITAQKIDFTLPWQHLQRVRNAIAPLLLGSILGILHPIAGITVSEPTDKHAVLGMLSSHSKHTFVTPCSPIRSLSIIEQLAQNLRQTQENEEQKEIFSKTHLQAIRDAKSFESSLEKLQAQEYIHKITNITLFVMHALLTKISQLDLDPIAKERLTKLSFPLIPALAIIDFSITLLVQSLFLITGLIQFVSGRGIIYTEVTSSPLMHVSFLIQSTLKLLGTLIGSIVWVASSPKNGFVVSLMPTHFFFKLQMYFLMLKIKLKLQFAKNDSLLAIPIVFGRQEISTLAVPTHNMHKTYLVVEKKQGMFNLYWTNRPNVSVKSQLDEESTLNVIHSMLNVRFPFMDIEKMLNYPVRGEEPPFFNSSNYANISGQSNITNCVVSNLFGMLETIDRIQGNDDGVSKLRYKAVKNALIHDYGFYKSDINPLFKGYSMETLWDEIEASPSRSI